MRIRPDGSVQPTSVPTYDNVVKRGDFAMYRGMVTRVIYKDDPNNITQNAENPEVLYDVIILGGQKAGQVVSNCRLSSDFGGNDNFQERTLPAATKKFNETPLEQQDGAVVIFHFTQGHSGYPVITSIDGGTKTSAFTGATKAEAPRLRQQYNGIFEEIDRNGDYTFIRKGGMINEETGHFQSEKEAANFTYERTIKGSVEEIKRNTDTIKQTFDSGENPIVSIEFKSGMKISFDGKNDTIELKDNGTGKLKISGEKVAIGASSAELLEQVSQALEKIATWAGSVGAVHTHIGNLGYPSAPPDVAAQYTTLQSDLNAIKALVDGIKGTL